VSNIYTVNAGAYMTKQKVDDQHIACRQLDEKWQTLSV